MSSAFSSTSNEAQKRSNVKLQAQQVPIFNGNPLMWHTWKKKTCAAVGTAGMLGILDDESYAVGNPMDNETIYHLLQVATSDGNAAHHAFIIFPIFAYFFYEMLDIGREV